MMTKIVEFTKKHKYLGFFIKGFMFIALQIISINQEVRGVLRQKFHLKNEYQHIEKLKDKYAGKRCFIICTGPSLTIDDLELIKNEYTFAMNSISLLYEKTDFRPTFYGCIDEGVFNQLQDNIFKYDSEDTEVFISNRIRKLIKGDLPKQWFNVSCNVAYHTYDRWFRGRFWCKFSNDAVRGIYDMYSVTHFLIQIAVYIGFEEIYLIGADCTFPKGCKIHFVDHGVQDTTIDTARERNICGYEEVKRFAEAHNVKVYNSTRGGKLEIFDRVDLDELISE